MFIDVKYLFQYQFIVVYRAFVFTLLWCSFACSFGVYYVDAEREQQQRETVCNVRTYTGKISVNRVLKIHTNTYHTFDAANQLPTTCTNEVVIGRNHIMWYREAAKLQSE